MKNRICKALILSLITACMLCANSVETKAYEEVVLVIDPGHGGTIEDDNTNGGAITDFVQEKDVNLITAKALADYLEDYGNVAVYLTRTEDVQMTLQERVDFAKNVGADYLISVHYNASANHNFFGTEIFTSAFGENYAKGHSLAECIMSKWTESGEFEKQIKTRIGKKGEDYYGLIRIGTAENIPTIILEHGYLDNDHDFSHLQYADEWEQKGRLDAQGIVEYLGLEKGVVKEKINPTVQTAIPKGTVMPDDTPPEDVRFVITAYNPEAGDFSYEIEANDPESKLVYYGFVQGTVDADTVFADLKEWDSDRAVQKGVAHISPNYSGAVTARVYNAYELSTDVAYFDLSQAEVDKNIVMSTNDGYSDDGYGGYSENGYGDDGYSENGYGDDGYSDDGYSDDGYSDDDDGENVEDGSDDGGKFRAADGADTSKKTDKGYSSDKSDDDKEAVVVDGDYLKEKEEMKNRMKNAIDRTQTITEATHTKLVIALWVAAIFGVILVILLIVVVISGKRNKRRREKDEENYYDNYSDRFFD